MKIAISSESTCDLTKDLIEKYDVKIVPYKIQIGERSFYDGELSTPEIFELAERTKELPKTSAVNEHEFTEHFTKLKQEYDGIIHISLSSHITAATANASSVAKQFENVHVIDSLSLSTGLGLLVRYAGILVESGADIEEICAKLEERKKHIQASFVIERLDYLYKGGRCSSLAYFGANLLRLRPRIVMKDGSMRSDSKFRGPIERVVEKYCKSVLEDFNTPDLDCVFITYTTATDEMVAAARTACENAGFKNIYETHAGGTIASHCGGHTLGILYFNDGNK
ncbi:MAG: DegV family protein [Clostridiales bacterium]|nr:DegV family protein [Clostridiales bacterium]